MRPKLRAIEEKLDIKKMCAHVGSIIWVLSQPCLLSFTAKRKFVPGPVGTEYKIILLNC